MCVRVCGLGRTLTCICCVAVRTSWCVQVQYDSTSQRVKAANGSATHCFIYVTSLRAADGAVALPEEVAGTQEEPAVCRTCFQSRVSEEKETERGRERGSEVRRAFQDILSCQDVTLKGLKTRSRLSISLHIKMDYFCLH